MAFEPILWKDRQIERPNTFTLKNNPDGTYTLIPVPGTIFEPGTALSAQTLNLMQDKIKQEFNTVNTYLADIETEFDQVVGNLTVDSEVINARNSGIKGKTFANLDLRFEDAEKDSYFPIKNLITNGDFSNGTTGWATVDAVVNGVAEKTALTQYSAMVYIISNTNLYKGRKIYAKADVKTDSSLVNITITDGITLKDKAHTGSNNFESLSVVHTVSNSATVTYFKVQDNRAGGWTKFYVDNVLAIDLTTIFGAGNEPSKEEMDKILSYYPNSWFDGTVNLAENAKIMKFLLNEIRSKASVTQENWITPTLINGWESFDASSIPQYRKDSLGYVHMRGLLKTGVSGTIAFSLPMGYRPSVSSRFVGTGTGVFGYGTITTAGSVLISSYQTYISLDQIIFPTV